MIRGNVYPYQTKSGTMYLYSVYLNNQKREFKRGFKTEEEARIALDNFLEKKIGPTNKYISLSAVLVAYNEYKYRDSLKTIKVNTYERYQSFQRIVAKYYDQANVHTLTNESLNEFFFYLKDIREVSNNTIIKYYRWFKAALKWAHDKGIMEHDPFRGVEIYPSEPIRLQYWTTSDLKKYLPFFELYPKMKNAVQFAVLTCARAGEICALKWKDVSIEDEYTAINKTQTYANKGHELTSVKSFNSHRDIYNLPEFTRLLEAIKATSKHTHPNDFILCHEDGRPFTVHYISLFFKRIVERHDMKIIRFHDLRHTGAILLKVNGVSLYDISRRLGHADYGFTANTYLNISLEEQKIALGGIHLLDR